MKNVLLIVFLATSLKSLSQDTTKMEIPSGVVYKYCDPAILAKAKEIVTKELSEEPSYELLNKILFVGPVIWERFKKIKTLKNIEGGNMTLLVDNDRLTGKMTQSMEDSKKVWDELRKEIGGKDFTLRNATKDELTYYWSVISFDIEEPLIIVETKNHDYILDLSADDMRLLWLDEAPKK